MFNIEIGSIIKGKYSEDIMEIVNVVDSGNIPVYEAAWIRHNGDLSKGSLFIFGSQINDYKVLPVVEESIFDEAIAVLRG